MAYHTTEIVSLSKTQMNLNGGLANSGLTSTVKYATVQPITRYLPIGHMLVINIMPQKCPQTWIITIIIHGSDITFFSIEYKVMYDKKLFKYISI